MMARRSGANPVRRLGCIILLIGLAVVAFVGFRFVHGWTETGPATQDISIVVPEGSTLSDAAVLLKSAGAVRSADAFLTRAKVFGGAKPIKAGEFVVPKGASNREILSILQGGKTLTRLVTIPEGMPSIMVYERLMANDRLSGNITMPAEGSVLPDSYAFGKGEPRAAVLKRMQAAMTKTMDELWPARSPNTVVKTPLEALTLASIVEKETALKSELRIVAGVYSNRLRKGMMLQADPTIIYPITKGKPLGRRIRQSEIADVNDYNTYAMTGLPKGPIANPSRAAIAAVLNPQKTTAYYFVADGKGGHVFADTLQEHNANVEKWFALRKARARQFEHRRAVVQRRDLAEATCQLGQKSTVAGTDFQCRRRAGKTQGIEQCQQAVAVLRQAGDQVLLGLEAGRRAGEKILAGGGALAMHLGNPPAHHGGQGQAVDFFEQGQVQAAAELFVMGQGAAVENRIAFAPGGHQAGLGQHLEVVADAGLADGKDLRQFQHAEGVVAQGAQHIQAQRITAGLAQGGEGIDGLEGRKGGAHIHRLGSLVGHFSSSNTNIKKF